MLAVGVRFCVLGYGIPAGKKRIGGGRRLEAAPYAGSAGGGYLGALNIGITL